MPPSRRDILKLHNTFHRVLQSKVRLQLKQRAGWQSGSRDKNLGHELAPLEHPDGEAKHAAVGRQRGRHRARRVVGDVFVPKAETRERRSIVSGEGAKRTKTGVV